MSQKTARASKSKAAAVKTVAASEVQPSPAKPGRSFALVKSSVICKEGPQISEESLQGLYAANVSCGTPAAAAKKIFSKIVKSVSPKKNETDKKKAERIVYIVTVTDLAKNKDFSYSCSHIKKDEPVISRKSPSDDDKKVITAWYDTTVKTFVPDTPKTEASVKAATPKQTSNLPPTVAKKNVPRKAPKKVEKVEPVEPSDESESSSVEPESPPIKSKSSSAKAQPKAQTQPKPAVAKPVAKPAASAKTVTASRPRGGKPAPKK